MEGERLQQLSKQLAAVRLLAATKAVLFLAEDLISGYNRFKAQHAKLDYEDLIVLTRRLLDSPQVPQWVMFKLDGGIDNILIDEAQDTSPDQWAIVKALTAGFFDDAGAGGRRRTVLRWATRSNRFIVFRGRNRKSLNGCAVILRQCWKNAALLTKLTWKFPFGRPQRFWTWSTPFFGACGQARRCRRK